jgi:hypothetical protein
VVVLEYPRGEWVGKNLRELAEERGTDPVQMAIDLQLEGDPNRRGGGRLRGFSMSEADVEHYAGTAVGRHGVGRRYRHTAGRLRPPTLLRDIPS